MAPYALSRRVLGRGLRRLYLTAAGVWTVLWVSATVLGRLAFGDRTAYWYWFPVGLIVAAPMVAAAALAAHRATRGGERGNS
ncbi:hypothetical protein [Rhizomonospora bruguierae]|uniref:hypothetical protein n=1 Tax=Rhizomonospora bruguierae TaxID=1581705 RepID=UPI001BD12438|nr:hypothetical protein [Micromonospora sp. NBRC 107566]